MDKSSIIRRVLAKLNKEDSLTTDKAMEIIFKDFVEKKEILKPNFEKNVMIKKDQHDQLRKIYDNAPVKQLYTYSLGRFGFILEGIRFDVDPASVEIKKVK